MNPAQLWGWDGTVWRAALIDATGHLQIDVTTSTLPAGAASLGAQNVSNDLLSLIFAKFGAGLPAALDATALKVKEQSPIAGFATSANQTTMITALQLIDDLRNALGTVNTDDLQVDVKDIADGEIKLYGYDGTNWQTLLTENAALKNLRVKIYDGAYGIPSNVIGANILSSERGLVTYSTLSAYDRLSEFHRYLECQLPADNIAGPRALFVHSLLYGYDGSTFDRLRTKGTGVLAVGKGNIDATLVRVTATGSVAAGARLLHQMCVNPSAASAVLEITDATIAAQPLAWDMFFTARETHHYVFDPPIPFTTGIYIETLTGITSVMLCYE